LLTLAEVRSEVTRIMSRVGGPPVYMEPHYGQSDQDGSSHIEIDDRYHYVTCERGRELSRRSTPELDTLLYWIARDVSWSVASHVTTHKGGQDRRRTAFRYWVNSIARLDAGWAKRVEAEQADILREHPFVDDPVG
jgi:hypothetical protein